MNAVMLFITPALMSVALMADVTPPLTPVDDVLRQLLNLGVGGVIALVFYWQWRTSEQKREQAEKRERALLLKLAKLDVDEEAG